MNTLQSTSYPFAFLLLGLCTLTHWAISLARYLDRKSLCYLCLWLKRNNLKKLFWLTVAELLAHHVWKDIMEPHSSCHGSQKGIFSAGTHRLSGFPIYLAFWLWAPSCQDLPFAQMSPSYYMSEYCQWFVKFSITNL